MAKHDERLKLEIVQKYLSGSAGQRELAQRYGVGRSSLRSWINGYREHGERALRKKRSEYSAQFKLSVLCQMRRQALSQTQAAARFDLRGGAGVVARWQRLYDEGGLQALHPKPRGGPKTMPKPKPKPTQFLPPQTNEVSTLEVLRQENEALRAEVAYLKKLEALVRARRQAAQKKRKPSSS